ncbi:hypothetical protein VCR26J2_350335 [Vibrio coralliirubri]|nr:hypothetical protein VCR26J2_350335 [Vibrio coralliirubri]
MTYNNLLSFGVLISNPIIIGKLLWDNMQMMGNKRLLFIYKVSLKREIPPKRFFK